ncbi:hypothetical protein Ciccas_010401 [Cichlidogyrus casuarinus]|uniref:Tubulin-specific chaperone D n=1 Tax=Cichlidogyrus casuarinus TaxID=1844966 RepID=A0ABD2PU78_9PLAT
MRGGQRAEQTGGTCSKLQACRLESALITEPRVLFGDQSECPKDSLYCPDLQGTGWVFPPDGDPLNRLVTFGSERLSELYSTVRGIGLKTTIVSKLRNVICILADLLQFSDLDVFKLALGSLARLLCHSYPMIRKFTANKLFESLSLYSFVSDSLISDQVTDLLLNTVWESDLQQVREHRNKICKLLNVEMPQPVQK